MANVSLFVTTSLYMKGHRTIIQGGGGSHHPVISRLTSRQSSENPKHITQERNIILSAPNHAMQKPRSQAQSLVGCAVMEAGMLGSSTLVGCRGRAGGERWHPRLPRIKYTLQLSMGRPQRRWIRQSSGVPVNGRRWHAVTLCPVKG